MFARAVATTTSSTCSFVLPTVVKEDDPTVAFLNAFRTPIQLYGKVVDQHGDPVPRIPGGGFVWNDGDYNFEAPESGYKESIRYDYPARLSRDKWKRFQNGRYFVKFADGSHARIRLDIDGGSDRRPLAMTSWLSLKPGSRNLASPHKDGAGFHGGNPEEE
jgi:hypothetical protein